MPCQKLVSPPLTFRQSMQRLPATLLVFGAVVSAAIARPLAGQTLTATQAREDFDALWTAVREAHGGLLRFQTRAELDAKVEAHRARLTQSMPLLTFAGILSESLADLRDGHARLEYDSATVAAAQAAPLLPLRVGIEDGKVIVAFNDSPADTTIHPGMELVSINGRPATAILRQLLPKISGDGFIETGKPARLARDFPLYYWLHVEQTPSFRIVMRRDGREVTPVLPGIVDRDRRQVVNPVNAHYADELAQMDGPRGNVAVDYPGGGTVPRLRVRAFDGQAFLPTLDSAFRSFKERGATGLILDLRGNGGGVDEYGAALVSQFVERPFRYFDHIRVSTIAPSFATWLPRTFDAMRTGTVPDSAGAFRLTSAQHPGVAEHQPSPVAFTGKVAVLIDGGTFSTAADVAAQLRSMKRATFIGEETAGGYEGNTSGLNASIVLPNSRLRLRIMMYDYWNAVTPPAQRGRGTLPDIVMPRRIANVLRGVDPAMERALAILREQARPPLTRF
jgi:hypothetical protein